MKDIIKNFNWTVLLLAGILMVNFSTCEQDPKFGDLVPDYTHSIIRSFAANGQAAEIDHTNAVITTTLPAGTDLSAVVVDITLAEGASVTPEDGSTVDFSLGPVVFIVTNNGIQREYTATLAAYGDPVMMTFSIGEQMGDINQETGDINISVDSDLDITNLTPLFTISEGTTATPNSGEAQDFSNPVKYVIRSNDGFTAKTYNVIVAQSPRPLITSVTTGVDICSVTGIIDDENSTVTLNYPPGADLSAITLTIEVTEGSTVDPASGMTFDFTGGSIDFTVTNEEGKTKTYAITAQTLESTKRVAFISGAQCVGAISEPDTKAAAEWLNANFPEDFVYFQASSLSSGDLDDTEVLLFYWDNVGSAEMPDGGITGDQVQIIKDYYLAGGNIIVEGFAINHLDDLGRIEISGVVFTNEGGNTNPVGGENLDAWGLRGTYAGAPDESLNHPILADLDQDGLGYYPMNNAQYKEDRNFGIDFGPEPYNSLFTAPHCTEERALEFETLTNGVLIRWYEWLEPRGCGIGLAEFKPKDEYQGTMILNTGGWLEWSMEDNNGATNDYESNIHQLHLNAVNYLLN